MPLIQCIVENYPLQIRIHCEDDACRFCSEYEHDRRTNVRLQGELITFDDRCCDCIIFLDHNRITIYLVELKSTHPDIVYAKSQIENGARKAIEYIGFCMVNANDCEIIPVILHKSKDSSIRRKIRMTTAQINGKKVPIRPGMVGCRLSEIS